MVEKQIAESIKQGYKNILDDMKNRNITGKYYDEAEKYYNRLLELIETSPDANTLYAKMNDENIAVRISDAYTRALTEIAENANNGGAIYDDDTLMKMYVKTLHDSVKAMRDGFEKLLTEASEADRKRIMVDNNPEELIKGVEELIALSEEPGMTYPNFLRLQIERGLDDFNASSITRKVIETQLECYRCTISQDLEIKVLEEKLEAYDKLASMNKFGKVDAHVWEFVEKKIEWKYAPEIKKRDQVYHIFKNILDDLDLWEMAHCPFAMNVEPWAMIFDVEKRKQAIERDKNIMPGVIWEYEKLLLHYFGLKLKDIIHDQSFIHEIKAYTMVHSQEIVEHLLLEVYPVCKPFNPLPQSFISKRTEIQNAKREENPDQDKPFYILKEYYDARYGEEYMERISKGMKPKKTSAAKPWDLEEFLNNVEGKIGEHNLDEAFEDQSPSMIDKAKGAVDVVKEKSRQGFSLFKKVSDLIYQVKKFLP